MNKYLQNNQVVEYFDLLQVVFAFYFEKTTLEMGVEDLHKLRVEIKKQRAFFRFLEELMQEEFDKSGHFKILSSLFKPGGRLRETHVNQALVNRYRSYPLKGYKKFLAEKDRRQTKKFTKAVRQFDLAEIKQLNYQLIEYLGGIDFDLVVKKSLVFINNELASIRRLKPMMESDKELHQIRTHTKALGYIAKFLNSINPSPQLSELLNNAKPTEKLIGNWHDRLVLQNSLQNYLNRFPEAEDQAEAEKLIQQIRRRNLQSVKLISSRLEKFLDVQII